MDEKELLTEILNMLSMIKDDVATISADVGGMKEVLEQIEGTVSNIEGNTIK